MRLAEALLIWGAIGLYSISGVFYLLTLFFQRLNIANYLAAVGFASETTAIAIRWISTGHPPVYSIYEHTLYLTFAIVLAFLVAVRTYSKLNIFGFGVMIIVLFMLGHGVINGTDQETLSVQYQSNWLWVHLVFGQLAYGSYTISALFAIAYLLKNRYAVSEPVSNTGNFYNKLPDLSKLDELILKFVAIGFIGETGLIATGSIWAAILWGSYWSWEPIQTWSLISWLIYGVFLHLRLTLGWKGKKTAWLSLICFAGVMFTFWATGLISVQHTRLL